MVNSLVFHAIILCFLCLSVWESQFQPQLVRQKQLKSYKLSPFLSVVLLAVGLVGIIIFILVSPKMVLQWYMKGSFGLLLIGHALWFGLNKNMVQRIMYVFVAIFIIIWRIVFPSLFTHNLFIFFSLLWIGPFFAKIGVLTYKRFVWISILWFIYDIIYVWLTPLATHIVGITDSIGFPLSIGVDGQFIGSADLLWANCFISLLPSLQRKWVGVLLLFGSNIALTLLAPLLQNLTFFPLLVLWVPIGLFLLIPSKQN